MEQKEIQRLWIEYLKESDFKKKHGAAKYQGYIKRIKSENPLAPWPIVRPLYEIIGSIFDRAESEAISDGDMSAKNLRKRLLFNVKQIEKTSLLLMIHCPGIKPRGGQKEVKEEVGRLIKEKLKDTKKVRELYASWTAAGERIDPELSIYLALWRANKTANIKISELDKIAQAEAEKIKASREATGESTREVTEAYYQGESAIRRAIGYAERIIRNVESGIFPGEYK